MENCAEVVNPSSDINISCKVCKKSFSIVKVSDTKLGCETYYNNVNNEGEDPQNCDTIFYDSGNNISGLPTYVPSCLKCKAGFTYYAGNTATALKLGEDAYKPSDYKCFIDGCQ